MATMPENLKVEISIDFGPFADQGHSLAEALLDMAERIDPTTRACRICGCTDEEACPGGCHWIEADLCSECAP